jgi:hypothetical protein
MDWDLGMTIAKVVSNRPSIGYSWAQAYMCLVVDCNNTMGLELTEMRNINSDGSDEQRFYLATRNGRKDDVNL